MQIDLGRGEISPSQFDRCYALKMLSSFRRNLLVFALVVTPIVSATLYVWADRRFELPGAAGMAIMAASLLVGLIGIWLLPTGRWVRVAAAAVYVPSALFITIVWSFLFACGAYEMCV